MTTSGIRGLWHVALRVKDLPCSEAFYTGLFGMQVVWRPDHANIYLSSGADNLALHQIASEDLPAYDHAPAQFLDHLGMIVDSPETVRRLFENAKERHAKIIKEPKAHRDGSFSFYLLDPDGNTIQVLYEPAVSKLTVKGEGVSPCRPEV
jgi:catechol 2,3-dioxygenase-like lactoylglutathione lyase family enzyme